MLNPLQYARTFLKWNAKGVKLVVAMAGRKKLNKQALEFFRVEGRRGGLKSGKARMEKLTPEQRSAIARKAAAARWGKKAD